MIRYLKKLFTKWILLLGLLPTAYDYISAYVGIDFSLPNILKYWFILLVFIYASYCVWKDENEEKLKLQDSLKNPIDYNIVAELTPINIGVDKYIQRFEKIIEEAPKNIKQIDIKIADITQINNSDMSVTTMESMLLLSSISASSLYGTKRTTKTKNQYKHELEMYKIELLNFIDNYGNLKDEMLKNIELYQKNKYFIKFTIENIGSKSDTYIDINILTNCEIFDKYDIYEFDEPIYDIKRIRETSWKKTLKVCGIDYRTIYQTRHSFATMMLENGEDILWLSNMLGHTDSSMTLSKYTHYIKRKEKKRGEFLNGTFSSFGTELAPSEKLVA